MKKLKYFCLLFILLPICMLFSGCGKVFVTNIQKTDSNGNSDIYTIYYSDGSSSTLSVTNGQDGKDGADANLYELYELCIENNLYQGDFQSFLRDYVNVNVNEKAGVYSAMNSTVSVFAAFKLSNFGETLYEVDAGAGVIYYMDAASDVSYVVTNCHVLTNYYSGKAHKLPEKIMLWQYGADVDVRGKRYNDNTDYLVNYSFAGGIEATCVGYSVDYDLAILKVSTNKLLAFNADTCAAILADGYALAETVYTIGNPEAEGISVTSGIVSVVSEEISIGNFPADNDTHTFRVMRVDAAVYGGNSGGGVFNSYGELVGIVNASMSEADNYNFALPVDNVKRVVDNLIYYAQNGTPTYSLKQLTMQEIGATLGENYAGFNEGSGEVTYSVFVEQLSTGLANNCGFKVGDVIDSLIIDDQEFKITRYFQIDDLLIMAKQNSKISFKVLRGEIPVVVNLINFKNYI